MNSTENDSFFQLASQLLKVDKQRPPEIEEKLRYGLDKIRTPFFDFICCSEINMNPLLTLLLNSPSDDTHTLLSTNDSET